VEQQRKIVPPIYFLCALILMVALHRFLPVTRLIAPPFTYAGVLLVMLGLGMALVAARAFNVAGTPVVPFVESKVLVTGGLYRITRNPMYLGLVLVLLGVWVLFGTLSPVVPIPIFALIIDRNFVHGEERFLEEIFGEPYREYRRRVRRWL